MNLFERMVEGTLKRSPTLLKVVKALDDLATETHNLGVAVLEVSHVVQSHHAALVELYARQGLVMKAVQSSSLDTKLPNLTKDNEPEKPN